MDNAISNTGPILHLSEINCLKALRIVKNVFVPPEVWRELKRSKIGGKLEKAKFIKTAELGKRGKDLASLLVRKYALNLGEAEAIVLSKERGIDLVFTDDLDARDVAKRMELKPHGSVGILLRAYQEEILTRKETIDALHKLYSDSSLYITSDLMNLAVGAVERHKRTS